MYLISYLHECNASKNCITRLLYWLKIKRANISCNSHLFKIQWSWKITHIIRRSVRALFPSFPAPPQKKIDAPSTHRLYEVGRGVEGRVVLNDATNGANFPFFAATNASSLLPLIRDFYAFLILMVDLPSVKGILIKFHACRVRTGLGFGCICTEKINISLVRLRLDKVEHVISSLMRHSP